MARPKRATALVAPADNDAALVAPADNDAALVAPADNDAALVAPAGFTPIEYVFSRPFHVDALYGTRITWELQGDVQLVPADAAAKMLTNNPDVYRLGQYGGKSVPVLPGQPTAEDDNARQELDIMIRTMGKEALENYAKTHFGQDIDRRKSVESLRQQVALMIDQFGAP